MCMTLQAALRPFDSQNGPTPSSPLKLASKWRKKARTAVVGLQRVSGADMTSEMDWASSDLHFAHFVENPGGCLGALPLACLI